MSLDVHDSPCLSSYTMSHSKRFPVHSLDPPIEATIVYGPGYISEAHITDESIDIEKELRVGMEVMALAFASFLGVEEV